MSAYEGRTGNIDAMQVTAANVAEVAKNYGLTLKDGNLYDAKGTLVNHGIWVCRFEDGVVKLFTDDLFKRLFYKIEPPTYKLSDIPDKTRDITRKSWSGLYIRNMGYCYALCDEDGPTTPYIVTAADLEADDWMIREE